MNSKFIIIIGLIFSVSGLIILALGLIISRKRAIKASVSRISEDAEDKNINLPHAQDRLRESRHALIGLLMLIVGFLLQIIGNWLQI